MGDQDLSNNYNPDPIPGPCGDAITVTGTASSARSTALVVGHAYRITAYGGGGYVKFGGSTVEAASDNYDFFMGVQDLAAGSATGSHSCDNGNITAREGYNQIAVLRTGDNNCTVMASPVR